MSIPQAPQGQPPGPDQSPRPAQAPSGYPMPQVHVPHQTGVAAPQATGGTVTRPRSVETAFWLWIAGAVVGVISAISTFTTVSAMPAEIAAVAGVAGAVFVLICVALFLLFAFFMRTGANWARIVLTVLGALGILGALVAPVSNSTVTVGGETFSTTSTVSMIGSILQGVIALAAIVMMFRPESSRYFRPARR